MKGIGICSWVVPYEGELLFKWAKEMKLATISLQYEPSLCETEAQMENWCTQMKAYFEQYDIAPSILGINTLCKHGMSRNEDYEMACEDVKKGIEIAVRTGIPMVHLPSFVRGAIKNREELDQTISVLKYAVELGEKHHIQVGHESALDCKMLKKVTNEIFSDYFYLLFDNENPIVEGLDSLEIYQEFADLHCQAHIKHNDPTGMPKLISADRRFQGVESLLNAMEKFNFSGWLILESNYNRIKELKEMEAMIRNDMVFLEQRF